MIAPQSIDEVERLNALRAFGILDTPPEPEYDDLTRLAASICGTPIALVSLIDANRLWFKSKYGLDAVGLPRGGTLCEHAVASGDLFEVSDAAADERFADQGIVTGPPNIRFYAGMPLITPDGAAVGNLCVIDRTPRTLTTDQRDALRVLARQVVAQLVLRAQLSRLRREGETFRVLFEQSSDAHLIFHDQDGIIDCNTAAVDMLRCQNKEQVLGLHPAVLSPEFQPCGRRSMEKCIDMDATARLEGYHRFDWTHRRLDGDLFPCEVTLTPVELHGRSALLVVWHDLSERKKAEETLRQSEELLRNAFEDAAIGMAVVAPNGHWLRVNHSLCEMIGYTPDELLATDFQTITHPDDLDADLALVHQVLAREIPNYQMEKRYFHKSGRILYALLTVSLVRDSNDEPLYFVSQIQDITNQKLVEVALRASEAKFRMTVDRLAEGLFVVDVATRAIVEVNTAALSLLGYEANEFMALHPFDIVAMESRSSYDMTVKNMEDSLARTGRFDLGRRQLRRKNNTIIQADVRVTMVPNGGVGLHAVIVRDVTEQVEYENRLFEYQSELEDANVKLKAMATTDGLTGIKNRAAFNARLTEEYDRAVRHSRPISVIMMDVDHFKGFNDTFGHPAGDEVLRTVAKLLQHTTRTTDFVARYGGEEFVAILPDTDASGAMILAERFRRAIANVKWDKRNVTISVGVATLKDSTSDAASMTQEADEALYRSKQAGRNRVSLGSGRIAILETIRV